MNIYLYGRSVQLQFLLQTIIRHSRGNIYEARITSKRNFQNNNHCGVNIFHYNQHIRHYNENDNDDDGGGDNLSLNVIEMKKRKNKIIVSVIIILCNSVL